MIHERIVAAPPVPLPDTLVTRAARCWRDARREGRPPQPALHALLRPAGYDLLAPVFDSLMRLGESRTGQAFGTGCTATPSADEAWLCRLLSDPAQPAGMPGGARDSGLERAFACALRSWWTMVMLENESAKREDVR